MAARRSRRLQGDPAAAKRQKKTRAAVSGAAAAGAPLMAQPLPDQQQVPDGVTALSPPITVKAQIRYRRGNGVSRCAARHESTRMQRLAAAANRQHLCIDGIVAMHIATAGSASSFGNSCSAPMKASRCSSWRTSWPTGVHGTARLSCQIHSVASIC